MITVNTHEAKTRLSELIRLVEEKHERVKICRYGKPIVEIKPLERQNRKLFKKHPVLGKIKIRCDLCKPITEDEWPEDLR